MNKLKDRIFKKWNLVRLIRLALGAIVMVEAWRSNEVLLGLLGLILLMQSVLDMGCCGSSGCDIGHKKVKPSSLKNPPVEINFTEVTKN